MPARVSNLTAPLHVVPGDTVTASVEVRNTGTIVDHFSCALAGEPAAWTTVRPPTLNLLPGASTAVELEFRPPRAPTVRAGATSFTLSVTSKEDPASTATAEGSIDVAQFQETEAKLVPQTAVGWRSGRYGLLVHNRGNVQSEVRIAASDPDEKLRFAVRPPSLTITAGAGARCQIVARARNKLFFGRERAAPFQVALETGAEDAPVADGSLLQRPLFPRWVLVLMALVVAAMAFLSQTDVLASLGILLLVAMTIGLLIVVVLLLGVVAAARNVFGRRRDESPGP
ncbi:MAG: hypothetical protein ABR613_11270 [Actinomycetota bacterium]